MLSTELLKTLAGLNRRCSGVPVSANTSLSICIQHTMTSSVRANVDDCEAIGVLLVLAWVDIALWFEGFPKETADGKGTTTCGLSHASCRSNVVSKLPFAYYCVKDGVDFSFDSFIYNFGSRSAFIFKFTASGRLIVRREDMHWICNRREVAEVHFLVVTPEFPAGHATISATFPEEISAKVKGIYLVQVEDGLLSDRRSE